MHSLHNAISMVGPDKNLGTPCELLCRAQCAHNQEAYNTNFVNKPITLPAGRVARVQPSKLGDMRTASLGSSRLFRELCLLVTQEGAEGRILNM